MFRGARLATAGPCMNVAGGQIQGGDETRAQCSQEFPWDELTKPSYSFSPKVYA